MQNVNKEVIISFRFTDDIIDKTILSHDTNSQNEVRIFFTDNTYCIICAESNQQTDHAAKLFIEELG